MQHVIHKNIWILSIFETISALSRYIQYPPHKIPCDELTKVALCSEQTLVAQTDGSVHHRVALVLHDQKQIKMTSDRSSRNVV